jgi:adenylate kinase
MDLSDRTASKVTRKRRTTAVRSTRSPVAARRSVTGPSWVALTGSPGTGKTAVSGKLSGSLEVVEVSSLALRLGAGRRRRPRSVEVDVPALRRVFRRYQRSHPAGVVVGHLAHFLPVSYIIVLRCHPQELARRLRRARRNAKDRTANILAETLDIVLVEALGTGLPVREVDTTHRSVAAVARLVENVVRRHPAPKYGLVNWLADRRVTEELLRGRF